MSNLMKKKKLVLAYYMYRKWQNKRRKSARKLWVHPILSVREQYGEFHTLYENLRTDEAKFCDYFRMNYKTFDKLLDLLKNKLQHKDTNMRASISSTERLVVTLRYLATGTSFADLEYRFRIGKTTLSLIIREVCSLIWSELYPKYMKMPCMSDWLEIANKFDVSANFPHCVGAVDGKHIRVIKPNKSGSMFLNYKHYFSIVLMAVADSDYNFIYINVGAYGKDCDSGVFKDTAFWHNMINNTLDLPQPAPLPNTNIALPYVFVGDEAFALHQNLLRPYNSQQLDAEKSVFNYRLTRARRYVECTFGILANKWRIFHRPLNLSLDLAVDIVKACCLLQNFIHKEEGARGVQESVNGCELQDLRSFDSIEVVPTTANDIRDKYKEYFNSEQGSVPWQNNYC